MDPLPRALREAGVTPREADVLEALGARLTNAEIADKLFISVRTVESHVSALLRKLECAGRVGLSLLAGELLEGRSPVPPLPAALADLVARGPFAGRAEELQQLVALFGEVRSSGRRRFVLLSGEAGIGKSRLAAEMAARLHGEGAVVTFGRCDEEALLPCQPFVEAVRPLVEVAPKSVRDRAGPALAPLLPEIAGGETASPVETDPALARHRLFDAFDAVLSTAPGPLLVVVDDLQWADRPTLLLLRHILRRSDRSPVLVLAAARREALQPSGPLATELGALASEQPLDEVVLGGLAPSEVAVLFAGHARARELARAACDRTGGNPFLLQEVLRHAVDTPAAAVEGALPDAVRESVRRRVARLGQDSVGALEQGAVMGEAFRFGVAARATGGDPEASLGALDRAAAAGVVVEAPERPGHYQFAHSLVREALVEGLSPSRRTQLHLRAAASFESEGADRHLAEIAYHRHAALPEGEPERAADFAAKAAAEATAMLAWESAAERYGMALEALEAAGSDDGKRLQVLLGRGDARWRGGELDEGRADFLASAEIARHLGDLRALAQATLSLGETSPLWGDDPQLVTLLEEARATVDDSALRALLTARLAQALYYSASAQERARLSQQALDDARASGDATAVAGVLSARHVALWGPDDLDERVEAARQIVRVAEETGDDDLAVRASGWLVADLMERCDLEASDEAIRRHRELAESLRQPVHRRDAEMWAAMRAMLSGNFDHAEVAMDRARDFGETAHDPDADAIWWIQRSWLVLERDDRSEMDALVEPYEALVARYPQVPAWRGALALLHARRADRAAAGTEFEVLAADEFAAIPRDAVWLNALTYSAETCAFLGDEKRAAVLTRLLEPYRDRLVLIDRAVVCKGAAARFLGLLAATTGDMRAAEAHLHDALARHDALGARPLAERTRADLRAIAAR